MTFNLSRMASAPNASNDSAQSPAWSRNALPSATWPRLSVRARASPANTSGGMVPICLSTASTAPSSGQSGCWPAGNSRHERGDQEVEGVLTGKAWSTGGSGAKWILAPAPGCGLGSGGVGASGGFGTHRVDGPLHHAAGGLGGHAELFADLAVGTLAPVVQAEA